MKAHGLRELSAEGRAAYRAGVLAERKRASRELDRLRHALDWEAREAYERGLAHGAAGRDRPEAPRPSSGARAEAVAWLRHELEAGPLSAETVKVRARDAGHAWRTVERAKASAGAESVQGPDGWRWQLT